MATYDGPGMRFVAEMTRGPGRVPITIDGRTACDCGCGLRAQVEIQIAGQRGVAIDNPVALDAAVDTLVRLRTELWGPRKGGG